MEPGSVLEPLAGNRGFGCRAPIAIKGGARGTIGTIGTPAAGIGVMPGGAVHADGPFIQPAVTSAADEQLLTTVSLQPGDISPPAQILPYASATTVRGQVSLDLCGAAFPSEALRTGRLQVGAYVQRAEVLSVEAILYRDAAAAKQALAELVRAKKSCPTKRTADGVAGQPPIKHRFNRIPRGLKAVSGVQRVTLDITQTDADGNRGTALDIYQRRGSIVVALYGALPYSNDYIAPGIGGMAGLANTLARRLLAAPQPGSSVT